jgi:Domain of Unknown Function (DUF1080)
MPLPNSPRTLLFGGVGAVGLIAIIMLVVFLIPGQPTAKYQSSDRNAEAGEITEWNFDADSVGNLPSGVEAFSGKWAVRPEADAPSSPNVLCQTGTASFPALSLSDKVYTDVVVTIRFKPISGRTDQAAGIIFRVQDKDNYYILRANALEDNVNLYIYASGKRSSLKGSSAKVVSNVWQELRVEATGNHFRGFLNGQLVVEATDESYTAGKVGLWTKADSITCFDNVQVTAQ